MVCVSLSHHVAEMMLQKFCISQGKLLCTSVNTISGCLCAKRALGALGVSNGTSTISEYAQSVLLAWPVFVACRAHALLTRNPLSWSYQDLVDASFSLAMYGFKFVRTDTAKITVSSYFIVEIINVFGQVKRSGFAVGVNTFLDALLLQTAKEGLSYCVIPTVRSPAHARFYMIGLAKAAPGIAAILRSLV